MVSAFKSKFTYVTLLLLAVVSSSVLKFKTHASFKDVGLLLGGTPTFGTFENGIANSGQMMGNGAQLAGTDAFIDSGGVMSNSGGFAGSYRNGRAINSSDEITGESTVSMREENKHASVNSGGAVHDDLGILGTTDSFGAAINNTGQIAGFSNPPTGGWNDFLYSSGVMTDPGTSGGSYSYGNGISGARQVASANDTPNGNTQASFDAGGFMSSSDTSGGASSARYGTNNSGQVTEKGVAPSSDTHAFISSNGVASNLSASPDVSSIDSGISDSGQLIGGSNVLGDNTQPFLTTAGLKNDIKSSIVAPALTLQQASGIDDSGQIVKTPRDTSSRAFTFQVTPQNGAHVTDSSNSAFLLSCGLMSLALLRRFLIAA